MNGSRKSKRDCGSIRGSNRPQGRALCLNLIVHRSNARLEQDLGVLLRHKPEIVITSVARPRLC